MKTHSEKFLKQRQFLLVLPLLALPFLTLAFWALGGGSGTKDVQQPQIGLNRELPGAELSGGELDKMSLYNQAAKDSLALREQIKADPYATGDSLLAGDIGIYGQDPAAGIPGYALNSYPDPNEAKVRAKLAQLEHSLNEQAAEPEYPYNSTPSKATDMQKLEAMMQAVNGSGGTDPEMQQIGSMLEAILDIQNPARAQEKLRQQSQMNRGRVYSVGRQLEETSSELLKAGRPAPQLPTEISNSFYDLASPASFADTLLQTAVPAVVHETQTIVAGSTIKMRLSEDIFLGGQRIPSGTFIAGICRIDGERLGIEIAHIRYGKSLLPVALSVFDLDGLEGIRVPGAIGRDAAKEGADRGLQSVQLMSLDPSIGAQAAGAGVEVAKGLFGKKAKLIRVTVKAGHPVLLMDMKARQEFN